ncbi:prepilin-type N-terminal cleavage/methylation domain-containing protein [Patescibacteria group bacterium]|nr:prepilin-type N-terminal cleavage/methylation domain-containing protein [Patescibacteria group bacterium]
MTSFSCHYSVSSLQDSRRGFTLIELLVVIGLLALLASFLIPTFQLLLSQYQLTSAANQVADYLRLTEQKTVTEQQAYGVTFSAGASTVPQFQFVSTPLPNGTKTSAGSLTLPNGISISAVNLNGNADIIFSTSGAPSVSGNVILLDAARNRHREIDIQPSGAIFNNKPEY